MSCHQGKVHLQGDPIYPPALYVPQRFAPLEDADDGVRGELVEQVLDWLGAPSGRFVLVLGDFGRGKTFLLHELARRIPDRLPHLTPLLIELRALEKARQSGERGLLEFIAQHLAAAGEDRFDLEAFRYMLREGRIALLFDGFDELALRVTYDRAADHLDTLLQAAEGNAKLVITSRTQHFLSHRQLTGALGKRVDLLPGRRLAELQDFDEPQIRAFLTNRYDGDEGRATTRLELIRHVQDLLGLSRNPRMLTFIADLDEEDLQQARDRQGHITSAYLYQLLLDNWLEYEYERARPPGAAPTLSLEERWEAVTRLALRLWQTTESSVGLVDLTQTVADALHDLADAERQLDKEQAAHLVGSGTLLVRTQEGRFGLVHQSVMEWLVAKHAADQLRHGERHPEVLDHREMSPLILRSADVMAL